MFLLVDLTMDRESIIKLGITAVALGVSFFIFWGPKPGSRRPRFGSSVLGLQNLGLTCFLNSLLQALASCPYFIEWLECHKGNGRVTDSLLSLLKLLCYERQDNLSPALSPGELISSLSNHGWAIAPQEQDAHELFLLLVTTLEEEEHKTAKVGLGTLSESLRDLTLIDNDRGDKSAGDSPITTNKPDFTSPTRSLCGEIKSVAPPFRGYYASQMQCLTCNSKSPMRYDKFDTLSLVLPTLFSKQQGVTLKQLLDNFVKTEIIDDFVCDFCNKDKPNPAKTSKATRTVRIGKLPKCLCLHIARTYITPDGMAYKRENYVDFPEYLAMGAYTQNSYMKEAKMTLTRRKKLEELVKRLIVNVPVRETKKSSDEPNSTSPLNKISNPVGAEVGSNIVQSTDPSHNANDGSLNDSGSTTPTACPPSIGSSLTDLSSALIPEGAVSPSGVVSPTGLQTPHFRASPYTASPTTTTESYRQAPNASSESNSWVTPVGSPVESTREPTHTPSHINYSAYFNGLDMYCSKQLYRVKAVVEHRGTVDNGHFVTYRRGPLKSNVRHRCSESSEEDRWYFTSDADVQESTLAHAMKSCAYLIFYEKCSIFEEGRLIDESGKDQED